MPKSAPDNETLLQELRTFAEELGRVPTSTDVDQDWHRSTSTYQHRFGSWDAARKAAGLPEPGAWQEPDALYKRERELRRMYIEEGMSQVEIAEKCGVSDSTISNWIRKFNINKEPGYPWRDAETLREMYWDEENSLHDLAELWDTNPETVLRWMRRYDIPRRKPRIEHNDWHDKELLERLYWEEGLTQSEIAERFDTWQSRIGKSMSMLGVETRPAVEAARQARRVERPFFYTTTSGYEVAASRVGETTEDVRIHQLVAIAEHGFDAVAGNVIHHRNEIPWDNRPENLEVLSDSEHKRYHAKTRGDQPPEGF